MKPRFHLYTLFCLICIPLIAVFPGQAWADSSCQTPAFFIEGVSVAARANDAEAAREKAMEEALAMAWSRLVSRVLINPEDGLQDNATVEGLVDYVRVDKETVLPKRYLATLTYCFDRDRTRLHLDEKGLGHAELSSGRMLVLPVWNSGDQPRLWRRPNLWARAWTRLVRKRDGLVDLRVVESLATERALTAEAVLAHDRDALAQAARLEGAEKIIVTVVTPVMEGGRMQAEISATLFNRDGQRESEFFRRDDADFDVREVEEAMAGLAREIETGLEQVWREVNRVALRKSGSLTLRVDARSSRRWSSQLEQLRQLPPVEGLKVIQLDSTGGNVRLFLSSSMRSLAYALEAEGLMIESRTDRTGEQEFVLVARDR
ncbi:MAG: hypothetical protein ACON4P_06080 [Candidatus Puniceispirillales bacterium]